MYSLYSNTVKGMWGADISDKYDTCIWFELCLVLFKIKTLKLQWVDQEGKYYCTTIVNIFQFQQNIQFV